MKQLNINSVNYNYLLKGFTDWLQTLGYADTTVNTFPIHVRELLYYAEQKELSHITQLKSRHVYDFIHHVKYRSSPKTHTALSASHVNKIIQSINKFIQYINQTEKHILDVLPKHLQVNTEERTILSVEEIKAIYNATFEPHRENTLAMGQRDRAIIAIFYGCGLRKDEGARLNITDINTLTGTVFVRKGKGNKQRNVPIAAKHLEDIKAYLEEGRNWFLQNNNYQKINTTITKKEGAADEAFFINQQGGRMTSFYDRFKQLRKNAEIETPFSTHSLRHSIATHLLQSGMKIEDIAKFLGHTSLESTQIYTHIINKHEPVKQHTYSF